MVFTKETSRAASAKGNASRAAKRAVGSVKGTSQRRKRLEDAAWWVGTHELDARAPSRLHKLLQTVCRADELAFARQVLMQTLPAPPKESPLVAVKSERELEGEAAGNYLETVRAMLKELKELKEKRDVSGSAEGSGGESSVAGGLRVVVREGCGEAAGGEGVVQA